MRGAANDALRTINAAATAIASADDNRPNQSSVQKRRWVSCWSIYWCFGSHKHAKRIGHAVLSQETTGSINAAAAADNRTQPPPPPPISLPFVAPPSSPASLFHSEPPSTAQSPVGLLSFTSASACMYSPSGPASIFAIGPYAHETQLVSPPVLSTFTTEPSTAPFTPPPESIYLTTPLSPEVPFARVLDLNRQNGEATQGFIALTHSGFQSYHLLSVGQLISPGPGISRSGASSPFPDCEFSSGHSHFVEFHTGNLSPKLLKSQQKSGALTLDAAKVISQGRVLQDEQNSENTQRGSSANGSQNKGVPIDHGVPFEITEEELVRCVEKKTMGLHSATRRSPENELFTNRDFESSNPLSNINVERQAREVSNGASGEARLHYQKQRSITLGSIKEFDFDNADGGSPDMPSVVDSDWSTKKTRVPGNEDGPCKNNWSFFSMQLPCVS